jgi:hypothetical protein
MKFRSVLAAAMMLSASALSANAACTTDTPLSLWGQGGSNGLLSTTGAPPANLGDFSGSVAGQIANPPAFDGNGVAHLKGSADCGRAIEDAQMDVAALAAALSTPVWLEPGENFAISGGLGFSDGSTAVGATGIVRFGSNLSGFVGGAFNTDDADLWAGKVGLRAGF